MPHGWHGTAITSFPEILWGAYNKTYTMGSPGTPEKHLTVSGLPGKLLEALLFSSSICIFPVCVVFAVVGFTRLSDLK